MSYVSKFEHRFLLYSVILFSLKHSTPNSTDSHTAGSEQKSSKYIQILFLFWYLWFTRQNKLHTYALSKIAKISPIPFKKQYWNIYLEIIQTSNWCLSFPILAQAVLRANFADTSKIFWREKFKTIACCIGVIFGYILMYLSNLTWFQRIHLRLLQQNKQKDTTVGLVREHPQHWDQD